MRMPQSWCVGPMARHMRSHTHGAAAGRRQYMHVRATRCAHSSLAARSYAAHTDANMRVHCYLPPQQRWSPLTCDVLQRRRPVLRLMV